MSLSVAGSSGEPPAEREKRLKAVAFRRYITRWFSYRVLWGTDPPPVPDETYMNAQLAWQASLEGVRAHPDNEELQEDCDRAWLHLGEKGMTARLVEAFKDLNAFEQFEL